MSDISIKRFHPDDDVTGITKLLHDAYAPLAEAGMRFVASWQDDEITRSRLGRGVGFLAMDGATIVGTITLYSAEQTGGCSWYDRSDVCSFGQFAVRPDYQHRGLGRRLLQHAEETARQQGAVHIALDTAGCASELIAFYRALGYHVVGEANWDETNYSSVIMSKRLLPEGIARE